MLLSLQSSHIRRLFARALIGALAMLGGRCLFAQAALLLEQPYGVFGTVNPTGHAAIFLEHVCADTPVHLRPCLPGETGIVISRYKGIASYDWLAIPLIPYLYAVEDPSAVPEHTDQETVNKLRVHYREAHLAMLGDHLPPGNFFSGGWTELVGTAYDRRTYAFRFATTPRQDSELIARLNDRANRSHFNIFYNNCADFDRFILNQYFPKQFGRTIFPDAGITTPKQLTYRLVKYAHRHPDAQLSILAIPQIPGYRRDSGAVRGVAEALFTNGYVIPVIVLNPYVAGGLLADYLVRGRYHVVPKNPDTIDATHMDALLEPVRPLPMQASADNRTQRLTPVPTALENAPVPARIPDPVPTGETVVPAHFLEPFTQP
jgi:hypothetical protein